MCSAYGVRQNTYAQRIAHGWSKKDALTKRAESRKKECKDHLGNIFESETEMCKFYNIDRKVYVRRKQLGWSIEEALFPDHKSTGKVCADHKGTIFKSYADLCRFYDLDWGTFKGRRDRGWSLKDILTKEVGHKCVRNLYFIGVSVLLLFHVTING